jgi:hypothetical protein
VSREEGRAGEYAGVEEDVIGDIWSADKLGQIGYAFLSANKAEMSGLKVPRRYDFGAFEDEDI